MPDTSQNRLSSGKKSIAYHHFILRYVTPPSMPPAKGSLRSVAAVSASLGGGDEDVDLRENGNMRLSSLLPDDRPESSELAPVSFSSVLMSFVFFTAVVPSDGSRSGVGGGVAVDAGDLCLLKKALIDSIMTLRLQERLLMELKVVGGVAAEATALTVVLVSTTEDLCCGMSLASYGAWS